MTMVGKSVPAVASCVCQPSAASNLKIACNYVRKLRGETPWQLASSRWRLASTMDDGETTTNDKWLVGLLLSFMSLEATLTPPPNPSGWHQRLLKLPPVAANRALRQRRWQQRQRQRLTESFTMVCLNWAESFPQNDDDGRYFDGLERHPIGDLGDDYSDDIDDGDGKTNKSPLKMKIYSRRT